MNYEYHNLTGLPIADLSIEFKKFFDYICIWIMDLKLSTSYLFGFGER